MHPVLPVIQAHQVQVCMVLEEVDAGALVIQWAPHCHHCTPILWQPVDSAGVSHLVRGVCQDVVGSLQGSGALAVVTKDTAVTCCCHSNDRVSGRHSGGGSF